MEPDLQAIGRGNFPGAPTPFDLAGWAEQFKLRPRRTPPGSGALWEVSGYGCGGAGQNQTEALYHIYYAIHVIDGLTWADLQQYTCELCKEQQPPERLNRWHCCGRNVCLYCHAERWCGEKMVAAKLENAL